MEIRERLISAFERQTKTLIERNYHRAAGFSQSQFLTEFIEPLRSVIDDYLRKTEGIEIKNSIGNV